MSRRRVTAGTILHVYKASGARWQLIRPIRKADGEHKCALGLARRLLSENGVLVGYEVQEAPPVVVTTSPTAITLSEMNLIAGTHFRRGRSRTIGLTEEQRKTRMYNGKLLPEEDPVELAQAKLQCWTPRRA